MRILLVLPSLGSGPGGAEKVICLLASTLASSLGVDVTLLTLIDRRHYLSSLSPKVEYHCLSARGAMFALPGLMRFVRRGGFDAVICSSYINLLIGSLRFLLPAEVRIVARETTIPSVGVRRWQFPRLVRALYRIAYPRFDAVIAQSKDMQVDLCEFAGIEESQVTVVFNPHEASSAELPNSERTRWFSSEACQDSIVLTCVGKFSRQKNFGFALDVLNALDRRDIRLNIVGDGPERPELEEKVVASGLSEIVRISGSSDYVEGILRSSDYLLLVSRFEGLSNVMIESLCVGTPVIALPAPGGILEVLEMFPGCKIAEDFTVDAMKEIMAGLKKGASPGRDARDLFDPEIVARRYLDIAISRTEEVG